MPSDRPRSGAELTPAERAAQGRAARRRVPRSTHAAWEPGEERPDPVAILEDQARRRVTELVPIRHGRMVSSPFPFFRGAAAIMAADLATTPVTGMRVQACGDAHLSNFGGFGTPERDLVFSINDFDETLPGPWEWDVKRLAASLAVSGRERGFDDAERRAVLTATVAQYRRAMRDFATWRRLDVWYARLDAADLVASFERSADPRSALAIERTVEKAHTKDNLRALAKLTVEVGGEPRIAEDPPLLVPAEDLLPGRTAAELHEVLRRKISAYRRSLTHDRRHLLDGFRDADIARKVVGVGSVGTRTWITLLLGRDGDDPLFLQFKEAQESVLAPYVAASAYENEGRRVVEGQRLMQSAPDTLLGWLRCETFDGPVCDFYVRQLWDWKMTADVDRMSPAAMTVYGEACAWTLARAHARTGDPIAIGAYLGAGDRFDAAIAAFAEAYADQNARDHTAFREAVASGRVPAVEGV
jgi:uncharacterized protein (DUF2252 family)